MQSSKFSRSSGASGFASVGLLCQAEQYTPWCACRVVADCHQVWYDVTDTSAVLHFQAGLDSLHLPATTVRP
jgi:hypothetical protein